MMTSPTPEATTPAPADVNAAAEAIRAELEGLVRIAARRPELVVKEGQPGCNWSFSWDTDVVTVNPEHLRSFAPDLCRGLALHEAAHAAVTVLQDFLPVAVLGRLLPLLNTLEDIRIEVWMRRRFPGAAPWIRAYNDVFYGFNRGHELPRSRQAQFLVGILELWWYGAPSPATLTEVLMALDECREAIAAATACQPPLDDAPDGILASQRSMWEIIRARIVPTWNRLVAMDRREGIGPLASSELDRFMQLSGACGQGRGRSKSRAGLRPRRRRPAAVREISPNLARRLGAEARRQAPGSQPQDDARQASGDRGTHAMPPASSATPADGTDRYLLAWKQVAPVADRLGDELLSVLVPRQRLRWSAGHAWGPRLDLRRAMQFEADAQLYRALWQRPILPKRRDPAVLLLVDRSSSMTERSRMDRAFEGIVLLTEVCRRIGVPAAVWSFARAPREELAWDAAIDGRARRRLGLLPDSCQGNTDMAAALAVVGRELAGRRGDPRILFVISDGSADDHETTLAAARRLDEHGVIGVGLGLGSGTAGLSRYFPNSVTEIPAERLVDHVASLLGEALLANA